MEVLTGERVVVRAPAPGDGHALVEMATDARVRRYLGGPKDQVAAEVDAARKIGEARWGQFVIVDQAAGVVAGSGSVARKRGPLEISYHLRHAFWRRGLAGEAVALVRDWFFANTEDNELIATTQQANLASQRLLERLGAVQAGSFERYGRDGRTEGLMLLFDGGHLTPEQTSSIRLSSEELHIWAWSDPPQAEQRLSGLLARRIAVAFDARTSGVTAYLENGHR
ncbi:GNAT family N-acetyltransferase [Mangrovihabitans endophyticus]|uniref:N-acetyltransferase domain-containing protein n=1 Tax=Mangrovihabitans endophyticus TaxID=1751298 RepID=A0A8J3BUX4_9ACTN|nr:GNAT family N-acetyltransferase [Mangrovihabitans endophyticus]GGK79399.1 hypothetical protein GCM10012284_11720 [Mangrovihabitans endophyticus]